MGNLIDHYKDDKDDNRLFLPKLFHLGIQILQDFSICYQNEDPLLRYRL